MLPHVLPQNTRKPVPTMVPTRGIGRPVCRVQGTRRVVTVRLRLLSTQANNQLFDKVLVANRGEIACRVIRTCRQLGVRTVAVYSDADAGAMHVAMADESYHIGASAAAESYLRGERILEVAVKSGAQAIHPGYGFLSENASFAEQCAASGIIFIGPPIPAITAMGSKQESKIVMEPSGVPCVPGYHGSAQDTATLVAEAEKVGYPLMIKAVMGGGGKGMRMVASADQFEELLEGCKRESRASFGDDRVLLERFLTSPRHVEFQVFADSHGNCVHLFERDCSLQRRHQKVIEEAPAPAMPVELRHRMGEAACAAARAVGYEGAGTVEFLLDSDGSFYFMEMNTRLQVEHPVTELITGQDLVEWQLRVAVGGTLPRQQEELAIQGHAFEARVYAEDPSRGFLPASGTLTHVRPPPPSSMDDGGRILRLDTGVRQGDHVSVFYDPMIAKLIVWAEDRHRALKGLASALEAYQISGVPTNISFLHKLATHPRFQAADMDDDFNIHFIEEHEASLGLGAAATSLCISPRGVALAALATVLREFPAPPPLQWNSPQLSSAVAFPSTAPSAWEGGAGLAGWRPNYRQQRTITLTEASATDESGTLSSRCIDVGVTYGTTEGSFRIEVDGDVFEVLSSRLEGLANDSSRQMCVELEGGSLIGRATLTVSVAYHGNEVALWVEGEHSPVPMVLGIPSASSGGMAGVDSTGDTSTVSAPMPGKVVKVAVEVGQEVDAGDVLVVVEAMKMEHTMRAGGPGRVVEVNCALDELVDGSGVLVYLEPR